MLWTNNTNLIFLITCLILSQKNLGVNGDICNILETYYKYVKVYEKVDENAFDSKYEHYRDIDQKDRAKKLEKKLSKLNIHWKLQKRDINNVGVDYDATSLYPSAMWDDKFVYPNIESGLTFKLQMNSASVGSFKTINESRWYWKCNFRNKIS